MSKIYLVRHGETEWNKEQRSQGCSNDIPLSDEGIRQAKALANRLKNESIDMFFSSSLKRASQTAKTLAKEHGKDVTVCDEFKEINFGCFEGLTFTDIKEKYNEIYSIWRDTPHLARIPDGEGLVELRERSMGKLLEIIQNNNDKNILIVSHGITIKVLITAIMGIDLSNLHKIRQDNTSLNIFEYRNGVFYTNLLNDICHASGRV